MKTLLIYTLLAFITTGACSQPQSEGVITSDAMKAEVERINKEKEENDVTYFKPQAIASDWSVVLASVKRMTPETTESLQIDQYGKVTLSVRKVLFGKPLSEVTLPYRYNNLAVFKSKDTEIRKKFARSMIPTDLIWPDLTTLKKPYLLVVINPHAYDPYISTSEKPTPLAAKVLEVSGEDDPKVIELLKQIPKSSK